MNPTIVYQRQATTRDFAFFQNPRLWKQYPFLPLVRRGGEPAELQTGVLYDARGVSGTYGYTCTVFLKNIFILPKSEAKLLGGPRLAYDTFDELADAGWVVD
jgi:hypothetical protein